MNKVTTLTLKFRKSQSYLVKYYQDLFQKIRSLKHLNFFTELYSGDVLRKVQDVKFFEKYKDKPLFGIPFFLKDNFMIKGKRVACGSKLLVNFFATFSATVFHLLEAKGAVLLGKTTMDELSLGGTGLEANEGFVVNPLDEERIVGGSSSGSAVAVAKSVCSFALGSDTGDSVRLPAAYLGIVGFKPTFGSISRYGLIPYSPSLDTVAFFAQHVDDLELVFQTISGSDPKDLACQKNTLSPSLKSKKFLDIKVLVIGLNSSLVNADVMQIFKQKFLEPLIFHGFSVNFHALESKIWKNLVFLYQMISYPEALSSQANLTGINFGLNHRHEKKDWDFFDLILRNRSEGFRSELKRRYILGALFTSKKYQKITYFQAMKMRTYIQNYFDKLFKDCDFIVHLATSNVAPKISKVQNFKTKRAPKHTLDDLFLLSNFLGTPSLVLPFAKKGNLSLSVNIFAQPNHDFRLINFAKRIVELVKNEV